MHRLNIYFCFLYLITLTSCGRFSEIIVGDISSVTFNGFEENALVVTLTVPVDNPTTRKITITDFDTKLFMNDQYLGIVTSKEPVIIKPRTNEIHNVTLDVHLANFFGMALNLMNLQKGQKVLFRLEGRVSARSLLMKRKIPINESREVVI